MAEQKPPPKGPPKGPPPKGAPKPAAAASSGTFFEVLIAIIVLVIIAALFGYASSLSGNGTLIETLQNILAKIKLVSTIISMIALAIAVYSLFRIMELSSAETKKLGLALSWDSERKQKNTRWDRVEEYMSSLNSSDWKIAVLEADNMLDEIVERMGYKGETLGDRMKNIEASDFPYLDDAWSAHKLRNQIAHKGTLYELTRSDAEQAINIYHRIFKSLGYL